MRWELSFHASDRLVERFPDLADDVAASMDNAQPFGWQRGDQDTLFLDDSLGIVYVVNTDTHYVRTVLTREQAIGNMQLFPPSRSLAKEVLRATQRCSGEGQPSKSKKPRANELPVIDPESLAKLYLDQLPTACSLVRMTRRQTNEAKQFAREHGGSTFHKPGPINEYVGAIYRELKRRREARAESRESHPSPTMGTHSMDTHSERCEASMEQTHSQ